VPRISIIIADDHELFRQGLRNVLSASPDLEVIGEAANATSLLQIAPDLRPDIVLLDIGMPGISSFDAAQQLKKLRPEIKILYLTMYDDDDSLVRAMKNGASGYVLKDNPVDDLIAGIREVARGGSYLSPRMLAHLVDDFSGRKISSVVRNRLSSLTSRERDVLKLLAEGMSVKEVANYFNLSIKTAEAHKYNLMRKLDVHNKAQLVPGLCTVPDVAPPG